MSHRDFKSEEGGSRKSRKRAAEREEELEYRRGKVMLETESTASISVELCATRTNSSPLCKDQSVGEPQNLAVIKIKQVKTA